MTAISLQIFFEKRFVDFIVSLKFLAVFWAVGVLLYPFATIAAFIHVQHFKTADSFIKVSHISTESNQPYRQNSEDNILKVYTAIFQQTWEQSPDIRIARKLKEQKTAEEYTAWAKRLAPQVDFEVSQKHFLEKESSSTVNSQIDEYTDGDDITDWNFDLDIPLYRRTLSLAVDISSLEYELAVNNLEINTYELDSRLHELLGNFMVACYQLHNIGNSILISGEHVAKIKRGYDLRDQTKLALLRAQANLKELEARKDLNEQKRDTAFRELLDFTAIHKSSFLWTRLQKLLGSEEQTANCITAFSDLDTTADRMHPFLTEQVTEDRLKDFFVSHSLLYKKIVLERDLGKTKAKKYTQREWPALFVRGEFDRKEDTRFDDYSGEGSIGLVLSVPLFSGGTILSNYKTEKKASEIASISEYSTVLRTFNSIANKKKTIVSLQDIFIKQQTHLRQQQEIVYLSLKSYQIKQTSMQDLLTSKNRLIDAKNLLMQTTADLGILLRQFAWELGTPFPAPPVTVEEQ